MLTVSIILSKQTNLSRKITLKINEPIKINNNLKITVLFLFWSNINNINQIMNYLTKTNTFKGNLRKNIIWYVVIEALIKTTNNSKIR